jgi:hypothetical protein
LPAGNPEISSGRHMVSGLRSRSATGCASMYEEPDVRAVVRALALYLRDNPRACDTAEGIRRWWLVPDVERTHDTVLLALDWMERHDLIEMTTAADGRQRFSRRASGERLEAWLRTSGGGEILS